MAKEQPLKLSKVAPSRQSLRSRARQKIVGPSAYVVGPGEPPPGFARSWNSKPEWYLYWALWKVLHETGDVRKGPFYGGEHFGYQAKVNGGRSLGGQIIDFEIYLPGQDIGLYLQGDRYHIEMGSVQHALDAAKMMAAARYMSIKVIYERDIIGDPTGEQACRTVVETLGGRQKINPITSGTYRPTRMARLYGAKD